jgi:hypothetical protein
MAVRDPQTEWLRVQLYRRMSPQQRIWIAAQLYEDGISIMRAAIRDQWPNLSPEEVEREVRRRLLPRSLFEQVERYRQEHTPHGSITNSTQDHWGA